MDITRGPEDEGGHPSAWGNVPRFILTQPTPHPNRDSSLVRKLLRSSKLSVDKRQRFWPSAALREIMTRERVTETLQQLSNHQQGQREQQTNSTIDIGPYIEAICPVQDSEGNNSMTKKQYFKVFAILLKASMGGCIFRFIDAGLSDDVLPLPRWRVMQELDGNEDTDTSSDSENNWRAIRREARRWEEIDDHVHSSFSGSLSDLFDGSLLAADRFCETQWQFLVPFFARDENYLFRPEIILPWLNVETKAGHTNIQCVMIEASCHGFGKEIYEVSPIFPNTLKETQRGTTSGTFHVINHLNLVQLTRRYPWLMLVQ